MLDLLKHIDVGTYNEFIRVRPNSINVNEHIQFAKDCFEALTTGRCGNFFNKVKCRINDDWLEDLNLG